MLSAGCRPQPSEAPWAVQSGLGSREVLPALRGIQDMAVRGHVRVWGLSQALKLRTASAGRGGQ